MKRSREAEPLSGDGGNNHHNRIVDEGPRLNLPLTKTPELINLIESYLRENYPCPPPQQPESSMTSNPLKVPAERLKALNFPISMITIGEWVYSATNPDDIVAKLYFAKKKLIWEFLDAGEPETNTPRLKRKIEIQWDDVASFQQSINSRDDTGILRIELKKRPKFFKEINPQAGKHTQWKQVDQDFTVNNAASLFRRHTLHFHAGVLQKNLEKLLSNSFWAKLYEVHFPVQEAIIFDIDFGSNNNNNNSPHYILNQTPRFNANSHLLHHPSQGTGRAVTEEANPTQIWANNGRQNSYGQTNIWDNTGNELFGTQAIPHVSSQFYNGHCNRQSHFIGSRQSNPMTQYESETVQNTRGIHGSQAYPLPPTQTNLMMPQHMNVSPMYAADKPYLGKIVEEEERHRREYTHLDGNFQIPDYQKIPEMDQKDESHGKDGSEYHF